MEPEVQCRVYKGSPVIHILSRINLILAIVVPSHQSSSEALCGVSEQICFYSVKLLASRQSPDSGLNFSPQI